LRILDISSESQGADASLIFNAIRCPLTPIFGSGFDEVRRHAVALDGPGSCRLAGRMIGDSPVGWSSARDVTIGLTVSHRVSKTYLFGQPFSFSPGSVDGRASTTAIRLAVDWLERGRADRRSDLGWTIAARLEGTAGLDGTATDIAGLASPPTDFTVIRGAASFAAQIGDPDTVISARFSGQWTRDILYSSEKLSVGGVASVRGYEEASALTDRGVSGSIEASRTLSANTPRVRVGRAELDPFRFRASVFLDGAAGSDAGGATTRDVTILSAGVGLSWVPHEAVEIRAERGWRLINADLYNGLPNAGFHFNLEVQPLLFFGQ
jgi:hemolysin activation/secretion protein